MPGPEVPALPSGSNADAAGGSAQMEQCPRVVWATALRKRFSPPGMLHPDGSVNQEFFRPKRVVLVEERRWGDPEKEALLQGLAKHGVGSWREISAEFLPGWEDQQLRLRTCRLLGAQNLGRYKGWKGGQQDVEAERTANQAVGVATGCWKGGLLVENDQGSVAAYLEKQQAARTADMQDEAHREQDARPAPAV